MFLPLITLPFLIVTSFVPLIYSFEFNNMSLVKTITFNLSYSLKAPCLFIIDSPTYNSYEKNQILNLYVDFAKSIEIQKSPLQLSLFDVNELQNPDVMNTMHTCSTFLSIILVGNKSKAEIEEVSKYIGFKKSDWIFFFNSSAETLFENVKLNIGSSIVGVSAFTLTHIEFLEIYKVESTYPLKCVFIGKCDLECSRFPPMKQNYIEYGRKVEGYHLNIWTIENWPLTTFVHAEAGRDKEVDGYLARIWYDLEEILNFTSTMYENHYNDYKNKNCIADLLLADTTITPERYTYLDFLIPIIRSNLQVYTKLYGYEIDWKMNFRPFSSNVWVAIGVWLLFAAGIIYVTGQIEKLFKISDSEQIFGPTIMHSLYFVVQTLCLQGTSYTPKSPAIQILIFSCYCASTILLSYYSGSLISSLTKKQPIQPFKTLEEIKNSGIKLIVWKNSADESFLRDSSKKELNYLAKEAEKRAFTSEYGYYEMYNEVCREDGLAAFATEFSIDAAIYRNYTCTVVKFEKPVTPIFQALAFNKELPFRHVTNLQLLKLWEFGMVNRHECRYLKQPFIQRSATVQVSINDVVLGFIILSGGIFLSACILFYEISQF